MIKLNSTVVNFETFPNSETRVDGKQIKELSLARNEVVLKYEDDSDLIKLMFVKNYLDELGKLAHLIIYYMPYSRMDRVEGNSVFTLKYVSNLINSLNFTSVEIVEPHSDVSTALINKSFASFPTFKLVDVVADMVNFNKDRDILFFPDAGSEKRYSKISGYKNLVGYKHRDFDTGRITELKVVGDKPAQPFKAIIVDDLCSYGGTFILSAEKLREIGATEIYLLVAHCEESIYKGKIFTTDLIDKVFTTNSILTESNNEKLHIFKLN